VIGVISNSSRFHSRYRLYREWEAAMMKTPNVSLYTVECAFGDRHHEVTTAGNPRHLQLRNNQEIWIKENMINLGVRHLLPRNWRYVAWIDCDVFFDQPHWALEAIQQLQHYPIIQPWQTAVNMGPNGNGSRMYNSVGYQIHLGVPIEKEHHRHHRHHHHHKHHHPYPYEGDKARYNGDPSIFGHCGYAWACRREFWEHMCGAGGSGGALIDYAILGSADHHMALGCRGYYSHSVHSMMKGPFMDLAHAWQTKAMQATHGVIGYSNGLIKHKFHGPMGRRDYIGRWEILIKHGFDPVADLRRDAQGLIRLVGKAKLDYDILLYNRRRIEDDISEF
jgi:hypothetical protein